LNDADVSSAPRAGWLWYFAYGSNMNPQRLFDARLARDGVPWGRRVAGRLDGWRLAFNKPWARFQGAGVANMVPAAAACVHGTLNEMPPEGLDVLDRYEGVADGHYARREIAVRMGDVDVSAVTYVAQTGLQEGLRPACSYLAHLLAGNDLLPGDYMRALAAQNCLDVREGDA
jgi:cation transport regulator ChaC